MKTLNFLIRFFVSKIEIDSKPFRRAMSGFFHYNDDGSNPRTITSIRVFETREKYIVEIVSHTPGILIGKGGSYIDKLKTWLKDEFKKEVEIDLKENKMWSKLY